MPPGPRNARKGYWNRRGDHLVIDARQDGSVVYYKVTCPAGRDPLMDREEKGFTDEYGKVIDVDAERLEEYPGKKSYGEVSFPAPCDDVR